MSNTEYECPIHGNIGQAVIEVIALDSTTYHCVACLRELLTEVKEIV